MFAIFFLPLINQSIVSFKNIFALIKLHLINSECLQNYRINATDTVNPIVYTQVYYFLRRYENSSISVHDFYSFSLTIL
jgi:hypothetical protein